MSIVDVFILAIMSSENKLPLSKIVEKIQTAEIRKVPSRLAIYKRLHVLKENECINTSWGEKGEKIYMISPTGKSTIREFKNQLTKAESVS
jgi:DNA-binding PadR family transcriptional regulator